MNELNAIASAPEYVEIMEDFSTYKEAVRTFVLLHGGCDSSNDGDGEKFFLDC